MVVFTQHQAKTAIINGSKNIAYIADISHSYSMPSYSYKYSILSVVEESKMSYGYLKVFIEVNCLFWSYWLLPYCKSYLLLSVAISSKSINITGWLSNNGYSVLELDSLRFLLVCSWGCCHLLSLNKLHTKTWMKIRRWFGLIRMDILLSEIDDSFILNIGFFT